MPPQKSRPPLRPAPGKPDHNDADLLRGLIQQSVEMAHQQVARSRALVAHSHEIVDRVRLSLAHASRIQHGIAPPSQNPTIPIRRARKASDWNELQRN